jgi:hypothetical protein
VTTTPAGLDVVLDVHQAIVLAFATASAVFLVKVVVDVFLKRAGVRFGCWVLVAAFAEFQ